MMKLIEYFNDPRLVLNVQNYFGVYRNTQKEATSAIKQKAKISDNVRRRAKTESAPSSDENEETHNVVSSDSEAEPKEFIITIQFWYYLFTLGTILGDEIFYATFIPFWFWNIDTAVGRRMVMVWASVMYIGTSTFLVIKPDNFKICL
jgi:sphingosine-1-phosphate phosphatase 1